MRSNAMQIFVVCFIAVTLTACGLIPFHLENPTKSKEAIKIDHLSCYKDAFARYPVKKGLVQGSWQKGSEAELRCHTYENNTRCTHYPATNGYYNSESGDVNAYDRVHAYEKCMAEKDKQYKCVHPALDERELRYCAEEGAGN